MLGKKGFTVWFTGLSGSGKTTISNLVHHRLKLLGVTNVEVLDGDVVSAELTTGHGFTREDLDTGVIRLGWLAHILTKHGIPNLVAAVSPGRTARGEVRKMVEAKGGPGSFIEVFVDCPLSVCEERDVRGMYSKARAGEIQHLTGVDSPYEPPHNPEVSIRTDRSSPEEGAETVLTHLKAKGLI
jgi:adenylylsulfate kinase